MKLRTRSWQIYGLVPLSKLAPPEKDIPMLKEDKVALSLMVFSVAYFLIRGLM